MEKLAYKKEKSEKFVCKIPNAIRIFGDSFHALSNFLKKRRFFVQFQNPLLKVAQSKVAKSITDCSEDNTRGHAQCLLFRA